MTDHTWGVDKSHFDSPTGTAAIVAEGFGFMTHKAGGDANDAELATWWADAKPHRSNILLGAYWVLYPGHGASAGDSFVARLDSQCPGWRDGPFILQLDCEEWNGDTGTMPHLADIRACANRLRELCPKLMPIVYAPHWAYGNTLTGLGYPLWSSSYTTAKGAASAIYPGDSYSGWTAYSGIVPTIAQFSSTATVNGDSTTDVNCFRGTLDELTALLAPGWDTEMAISSSDLTAIAQAVASKMYADYSTPTTGLAKDRLTSEARIVAKTVAALGTATADVSAIKSQLAAGVKANIDVAALAAALDALLPDVTVSEAVVLQAFRDMANSALPAQAQPSAPVAYSDSQTPIYDEADAVTKAARVQRQGDIQGS